MASEDTSSKLRALEYYLRALPTALPIAKPDARVNGLLSFAPDEEWTSDIGKEGAVNRGLEAALADFGPRNDDGIFEITMRGCGIEMLPQVLEVWLEKYPASFYLTKWLQNALDSAVACFSFHGELLPSLDIVGGSEVEEITTPTTVLMAVKEQKKTHTGKKPDTKILGSIVDPNYSDLPELIDERKGGAKMHRLVVSGSQRCQERGKPNGKVIFRCIASAGCRTTWSTCDKTRILRHLGACNYIAGFQGGADMKQDALEELGKKNPEVVEKVLEKVTGGRKRDMVEVDSQHEEKPLPKRQKLDPNLSHDVDVDANLQKLSLTQAYGSNSSASSAGSAAVMKSFKTEGRQALEKDGNQALVEFLVSCGIAANVLAHPSFANFITAIKSKYMLPNRQYYEIYLVPSYAAAVRVAISRYLKTQHNLSISFDGGKLTKRKFYTVHITTADHQSFCVELDDVSRLSQTGDYLYELLKKWLIKIGPNRFSGVVSDDAANCSTARRLICNEYPWILNMPDACHNLHNCIKDICNMDIFKPVTAELRALLAFMSLSTYTLDFFDLARKELAIARGLQSIGETRFGTIYWSINSVLDGIPVFLKIAGEQDSNGIDSDLIHAFDNEELTYQFKGRLSRLATLLTPLTRAIQCLEAKAITPADVYLYWLAVVAQLDDLMRCDTKSQYSTEVKEQIRAIVNYRFDQLIRNEGAQNIYLIAFMLDPLNRGSTIMSNPNPLATPSVTIRMGRGQPPSIKPKDHNAEIQIGLQLLLQKEYGNEYRAGRKNADAQAAMAEVNPYLAKYLPAEALEALKVQFKTYSSGDSPFDRKRKFSKSPLDWWTSLLKNKDATVLAVLAIKIFSAMPTSIVDERAMSTITWLNSPKRNKLAVGTVSDHLIIRNLAALDTKPRSTKPVTVNWRDMKKTIFKPSARSFSKPVPTSTSTSDDITGEDHNGQVDEPLGATDPEDDGLDWLDDSLPNLRSVNHHQFDLAEDFDISRYLDILADEGTSPALPGTKKASSTAAPKKPVNGTHDASSVALDSSLWST